MEGNYGVYLGKELCGKVQVQRQGLYYRFVCRCQLSGDVLCRLHVICGGSRENLGIVVPVGDGFGLDTRIPAKRLARGEPQFTLVPKHEAKSERFIPIYPEEPFSYISELKNAYLVRRNGQAGIMLK